MSAKGKRPSRSKAEKLADKAFGTWIKNSDGWACVCCGVEYHDHRMHAGHMVKRGKRGVRYDPDNVFAQCSGCNLRHNEYPCYMEVAVIGRIGWQRFFDVLVKGIPTTQLKTYELLEIAERYAL